MKYHSVSENLTAAPDTVVAFADGSPAYTDSFGVVRGRDDEPVTEGEIVWVKSRDAPGREIQFQISSDETGMLVGLQDSLDDAWEAEREVNEEWNEDESYSVTICYADHEPSLTRLE